MINEQVRQRLMLEDTALDGCREDLSDVSFEIGRGSATQNFTAPVCALVVIIAIRSIIRQMATGGLRITGVIILVLSLLFAAFTVFSIINSKRSGKIKVTGKTVSCGNKCWNSSDIARVECTSLSQIKVYSYDKKIFSFSWDKPNAEVFIAWVKKCWIQLDDNRIITRELR